MKITKLVITLSIVCFISGLSLSYFYTKTRKSIEDNNAKKELKLKQEIISSAKKFNKLNLTTQFFSLEEALDENGELVGFLIKNKAQGYGGAIEYLLGISFELEPRIINLKILSHKETPGLGAKVSTKEFLTQYVSKLATELYLKKDSANGKIESITGATITSRAITNSVRKVLEDEELQKFIKEKFSETKIETKVPEQNIAEKKKPMKIYEQKHEVISSTRTKNIGTDVVPEESTQE